MMENWYRNYQTILNESDHQSLADRIMSFLDKHAGISPNYDPKYDDYEERFTGPDSTMLYNAAESLKHDRPVYYVHSDWGSGTYKPMNDMQAKAEHDELVKEVNKLAKR